MVIMVSGIARRRVRTTTTVESPIGFVIIKLNIEGQTIYRKPHHKVTKLKSKFNLNLG